jgi:TolA-binding protein
MDETPTEPIPPADPEHVDTPPPPETTASMAVPAVAKPVKGVPRRPILVAVLNLSGLGAGYLYLRRRLRWVLHLAITVGLLVGAYVANASSQPAVWEVVLGAWVLWMVLDGGLRARKLVRRAASPGGLGGPALPVVIGLILIGLVFGGVFVYRRAGDDALLAAYAAENDGDCRAAVSHFHAVTTTYELTLSTNAAAADAGIAECGSFLAADDKRQEKDFAAAVGLFRDYLSRYSSGALIGAARDRTARTYTEWSAALTGSNDFQGAVDNLELAANEFRDTPTGQAAKPSEAETYVAWAEYLASAKDYGDSIAKDEIVRQSFGQTPSASIATADEGAAYVAWADAFIAEESYGQGLAKYKIATDQFADTPAAGDASKAIDSVLAQGQSDLNAKLGCDAVTILEALITNELKTSEAKKSKPTALYYCGLFEYNKGNYALASQRFEELIDGYPNNDLVPAAKVKDVDALVRDLKQGIKRGSFFPSLTGSATAGTVVLEIQNSSPDISQVLLSGPSSKAVIIDGCSTCVRYDRPGPTFCPGTGPTVTVTLDAGTYQVIFTGEDPMRSKPIYYIWSLSGGSKYSLCVIGYTS